MSTARTIVVNGDPGWRFADLLWAHGLDLFPPSSRVNFISALQSEDVRGQDNNYRPILGNFPEVYTEKTFGLADEIASEVKDLTHGAVESLAVLAVISAEDFDRLAELKPAAEGEDILAPDTGVSASGRAALIALRAALDAIGGLSGTKGDVAEVSAKLWVSLAVRDRGFDPDHADQAHRVAAVMARRNAALRSVFLLSNGRGLDNSVNDPHLHFLKLRLLIDVLQSGSNQDISKELKLGGADPDAPVGGSRRSAHSRESRRVFWLRLPMGSAPLFGRSTELRESLLEACGKLTTGEGAARIAKADEEFETKREALFSALPEATTVKAACATLESRLGMAGSTGEGRRETIRKEITEVKSLAGDLTKDKRGPLLYSAERGKSYQTAVRKFEEAIDNLSAEYLEVTRDVVAQERKSAIDNRDRFLEDLDVLGRPQSNEMLKAARDKTAEKIDHVEGLIASSRSTLNSDQVSADLKQRTRDLTDALLRAEGKLLGMSSLFRIPIVLALVLLLPMSLLVLSRWLSGRMPNITWATMNEQLWPLPHLLAVVFVVSLLVGLSLAYSLARRRDRARRALGHNLRERYDFMLMEGARKLARGRGRSVLSLLQLMQSRLDIDDLTVIDTATRNFIERLRTISSALSPFAQNKAEGATASAAVASALTGFSQGNLRPEKVRGYLRSIGVFPEQDLTVQLPGHDRSTHVRTRADQNPPTLMFGKPGHA